MLPLHSIHRAQTVRAIRLAIPFTAAPFSHSRLVAPEPELSIQKILGSVLALLLIALVACAEETGQLEIGDNGEEFVLQGLVSKEGWSISFDQLFSPTVWDDVAFGPLNMGLERAEAEQRTEDALRETGMLSFRERAPHHLSGGQKRMVAIAGIRAMQPEIVLYDEPSANLDIRSRRQLINFIKQSEETVLVSSHDLELVLEISDRIILIDEGQVMADGDPITVMSDEALMERHGLERPHSLRPHMHNPKAALHTH